MAGGGKTATSTSQVKIPPEVLARYNAVNAQAQQVAQQPFHPYSMDPNAFVAPLTPTQQAGIYNTNVAAGMAQPYFGQAGQAMQAGLGLAAPMAYAGAMPVSPGQIGGQEIGQYMSPFLGSVVGTTMAAQAQQNAQQRVAMQGQAIQQGAFGGDRANIGQANLAYQQNLANSQTLANLMNQGYGQALQTAQQQQGVGLAAEQANRAALQQQAQNLYGMYGGYGQALAGLGTGAQQAALQGAQAQLAAGQAQQQTGQAGLAAMYNQFMQQQSYPFQVAQFLANIAMGTGALSGSTTTTTQPAPFFSDRRLKHDIHRIGKTNDGQPIYSFKYNGDDRTQIGLMAQDVEKKHPEAVGLAGGYKTVDYEKATEGSHKAYGGGLSSMGGAVAPEHAGLGFERGGYLGGGLVSSQDLQAILARQQEQFPGYAQMGRDIKGIPGGGKSHVPGGGVHVPQLITAKTPTMQQQSAVQQAAGAVGDAEKLWGAGEKGLGAIGKASDWARGQMGISAENPMNATSQGIPVPPIPPTVIPPINEYRGGLVRARADGGEADDGQSPEDIYETKHGLNIPQENPQAKLNPAQTPSSQPSSGLGDLASIASIGSKIIPFFLKNGGLVPRHGYATDGEVTEQVQPEPDIFSVMDRFEGRGLAPSPGVRGAGAAGFGQVIPSTYAGWAGKYRSENPWMPATHEEYARAPEDVQRRVYSEVVLPREYRPALEGAGLGVTPTNVAAVNFLGPVGGTSFLKAAQENPNAPASSIASPSAVANNRNVFFDRSTGQERTVGEVLNYIGGQRGAPTERPAGLAAARPAQDTAQEPRMREAGLAPMQANISMTQEQPSAQQVARHIQNLRGEPDWMQRNQEWFVPVLKGLAGMAASPSRYLLGAALTGLGTGAQAYEDVQNAMQERALKIAQTAEQLRPSLPGKVSTVLPTGEIRTQFPYQILQASRQAAQAPLAGGAPTPGAPAAPKAPGAPSAPAPIAPEAPAAPIAPKSPIEASVINGAYTYNFRPSPNNLAVDAMRKMGVSDADLADPQVRSSVGADLQFQPQYASAIDAETKRAQALMQTSAATPSTRNMLNESARAYLEAHRDDRTFASEGAAQGRRAQISNVLQTLESQIPGFKEIIPDALRQRLTSDAATSDVAATQILTKLSQLSATQIAQQSGQHAAMVQQAIASVLPSLALKPEAAATILADMYAKNQEPEDFQRFAQQYQKENGTLYGVENAFKTQTSSQRVAERNALHDALLYHPNRPEPTPFLNWVRNPGGRGAEIIERKYQKVGPGLARYFEGG